MIAEQTQWTVSRLHTLLYCPLIRQLIQVSWVKLFPTAYDALLQNKRRRHREWIRSSDDRVIACKLLHVTGELRPLDGLPQLWLRSKCSCKPIVNTMLHASRKLKVLCCHRRLSFVLEQACENSTDMVYYMKPAISSSEDILCTDCCSESFCNTQLCTGWRIKLYTLESFNSQGEMTPL